jgi:hypothetical protein
MYTDVQVLLLSWKEAVEPDFKAQLKELKEAFEDEYNYHTTTWEIPSVEPSGFLDAKIRAFREIHDRKNNLLIVYYGGHGQIDTQRFLIWRW